MITVVTFLLTAAGVLILVAVWVLVAYAAMEAYRERSAFLGVLTAVFIGWALGLTGVGLMVAALDWPAL